MSSTDRVTIRQVSPKGPSLTFELMDLDQLAGGVGGWQTLDRPRRTSAVYWLGLPARTYTLPLRLDGMETSRGHDTVIEPSLAQLHAWGRPSNSGGNINPPPVLQLTGNVQVVPTTRWVINDISLGAMVRNADGRRIQQDLTLTLLEYVEPSLVVSHAKRTKAKNPKKKSSKTTKKKGKK